MDINSIITELSPSTIWLTLGVIFILMEVTLIPGIGFLFASLGAITLGGLIASGLVLDSSGLAEQILYFFFLTIVWAVILWKPLKKSLKTKSGDGYQNISGTTGKTKYEVLTEGEVGYIKWSGTKVRARICPESKEKTISKNQTVYVHGQLDGIFIVDTVKKLVNNKLK